MIRKASPEDLAAIKNKIESLKDGTDANKKWREQILTAISLKQIPSISASSLALPKDAEDATARHEAATDFIQEETQAEVRYLKGDMIKLADLSGDGGIDATLRDVVSESDLKRAISRVTEGGNEDKMKKVYEKVTGKEATTFTPDEVKEFQTKLRASLMMIQKLTGGNAGLYGLLKGELNAYVVNIQKLTPKPEVSVDTVK